MEFIDLQIILISSNFFVGTFTTFELPLIRELRRLPIIGQLAFSPPVSVYAVAKSVVLGAQGLLPEQYVSDEVSGPLNDDNEHNDANNEHQNSVVLSVERILSIANDDNFKITASDKEGNTATS